MTEPTTAGTTPTPASLSSTLQADLSTMLRVELRAELVLNDDLPRGAQDYDATFVVDYYLDSGRNWAGDDREMRALALSHGVMPDDEGCISLTIGRARLVTVDLGYPSAFDALDARDSAASHLGQLLRSALPDLQAQFAPVGTRALLVEQITVAPQFRGHQLSLTAVELLLREFRHGGLCAILDPTDPDATDDEVRAASRPGLTEHWSRVGFRPWGSEGILVYDFREPLPHDNPA
ncbi:hypothetical protein JOE57_001785 [Microlunatus panaciterrae]|uniref:N-acetyltransferase domain-containing protein n=1 Tax=Microlunatus panaciterrae TaxID=400768 RepID=A0ABS2RIP2_9ACTN|nr:hypothetical protein [Microlunatus panaciterrae]MBM7798864.1 hypothetical protein [Microlunatus panaciterrae]